MAADGHIYELTNVQKTYGDRTVLDIPHLTIERGEVFGLVGPSGAGKSTLLRLLALLETPTEGELRLHLDGRDMTSSTATVEDRRKLAMVFQRPALLSRSVWQNVAYGLRLRGQQDGDAQIKNVLERVSLLHLAEARPRTLSGGEMQRVAVARTLVLEPRVLLLDEPTANLDIHHQLQVLELVRRLVDERGLTAIMAIHDLTLAARYCDRLVLLHEGGAYAAGPPENVLTPENLRTVFGIEAEVYRDPRGHWAISVAAAAH